MKHRQMAPFFVVIDKPVGVTSHDMVAFLRHALGRPRVGHTGTLDPFATGVLPLAVGPATRWISFLEENWKSYSAVLRLGFSTDTGDVTGECVKESVVPEISPGDLEQVLSNFRGHQTQQVPMYSAIRLNGKRLYEYARAGKTVERPVRSIEVQSIHGHMETGERVHFDVCCSRGTYVRSLGEDIARALGTEGHLLSLRRIRSGPFDLTHALSSLSMREMFGMAPEDDLYARNIQIDLDQRCRTVKQYSLPLSSVFGHLPRFDVDGLMAARIREGQRPPLVQVGDIPIGLFTIFHGTVLVALAEREESNIKLRRVIPASAFD